RRAPLATLFPYTTLFRSLLREALGVAENPKHCLGLHHDNYLLTQSTARNLLVKVRDTSPDNCLDVLETALHQSALFVGQLTCEPDRKSTRLNSSHVKISY